MDTSFLLRFNVDAGSEAGGGRFFFSDIWFCFRFGGELGSSNCRRRPNYNIYCL